MPLVFIDEDYNGKSFLQANAGDWIDASVEISTRFSRGSGTSNKITYNNQGGIYSLTFQSGDWADFGFVVGDTIVCTYQWYNNPPPTQPQTFISTITYINGNQMQIADPFAVTNPALSTHIDGRQFPTDNLCSGVLVVSTRIPENIEWLFNLTPAGSGLLNSILDSEINRFECPNINTIGVGGSLPMTQLANISGGLIKDVTINYTYSEGSPTFWRRYRIDFKFWQWGIIKDGFTTDNPPYYDTTNCLAPISRFKVYPEYGNANSVLSATNETLQADTGGWDENYNGGLSQFTWLETNFFDFLGNPIDAIDYSNPCTFEAVVNAPLQNNPNSTYRIGLVWRPIDGSQYQNIVASNVGENLLLNAPEVDFIADGSIDPTIYPGYTHPSGAQWNFQNLQFEITGVDELTIRGNINPNGDLDTLMASIPDGGRRSTLWVSIGDWNTDGTNYSDRVSLKLFDADNYDAPTLGVQIPNVIDENLYDHAGNLINTPLPQTTTEDDVLYRSHFRLIDGVGYEGVRARIWAYNTTTEQGFTLEDIFFSFDSVPFIAGQFQPNFVSNRGFNLPPLSDRNAISLVREPSLDVPGLYALKIEYGYLSRWEYWLEQANVDNDFFDPLEMFNGKNKNWQRFSNSGDWIIRLSYYTRLAGVDDFNNYEVGIRPYEDDPNITPTWDIEVLSSGITPTNLLANELHEITATLVWSIGAYTNSWAEMTIEDFEGGNRWVISSVLVHGGIASNPLQPIAGSSLLDLTFPSPNIAVLKAYVDTNIVSADKVSMTARIYSEDEPLPPQWEWLLQNEKDALNAYSNARRLGEHYTGALIRVRRSLDNFEQDIPYIQIGAEWVLDQANLLAFVGDQPGDHAWVVTRYDQSSQSNNAIQHAFNRQPPIVIDGQVVIDPVTNRPAHLSDGIQMHHYLQIPRAVEQDILSFSVFNEPFNPSFAPPRNKIGFGALNVATPYTFWWWISPTLNQITSRYTNPAVVHYNGVYWVGAKLILTWGVSGGASTPINARLNGVNGNTQSLFLADGRFSHLDATSKNAHHKGYKSEDALYGNNRVQTELWIENNVNNFYQIF